MTSCPDCPDLDDGAMPAGWKARARCCRDEHIERRLAGDFEPFENAPKAREKSDRIAAKDRPLSDLDPREAIGLATELAAVGKNRRERRAARAHARKMTGR